MNQTLILFLQNGCLNWGINFVLKVYYHQSSNPKHPCIFFQFSDDDISYGGLNEDLDNDRSGLNSWSQLIIVDKSKIPCLKASDSTVYYTWKIQVNIV
jgi:hypothetical protein